MISEWLFQLLIILAISVLSSFLYLRHVYSFWKRQGVPSVRGIFPFGSFTDFILLRLSATQLFCKLCKEAGDVKYFGYYSFFSPALIVRDVDIIKNILVRDFNNFTDRGVHYDENIDNCSAHLFALKGSKWKYIRSKVTPALSSTKVKYMFDIMKECSKGLLNHIDNKTKTDGAVDFKDINARFLLDVIAKIALGIEEHNMAEDTVFSKMALKVTEPNIVQAFRFIIGFLCKDIASLFKLRFTPKVVENYFLSVVTQIINYREKNDYRRSDFIQQLIDVKNNTSSGDGSEELREETLTIKEITAQTFLFVIAGFETSSSGLSYCLYDLAANPDVQTKLRKEIEYACCNHDISYEKLMELDYLDMVINESLRLHPPLGFLQRECAKDYRLPDGNLIKAGTMVVVPIRPLHLDPKFFPNPNDFNPERFNKNSPAHTITPFTYMPFGEGPRICIGLRFSKILTKLAIFHLLSRYKLELCERMKSLPPEETTTFILQPQGGMWIRVNER